MGGHPPPPPPPPNENKPFKFSKPLQIDHQKINLMDIAIVGNFEYPKAPALFVTPKYLKALTMIHESESKICEMRHSLQKKSSNDLRWAFGTKTPS